MRRDIGSVFVVDGGGLSLTAERVAPVGASRGRVLFMHGGGQTRHSWHKAASRISEAGWEAVAYDVRGHGESDWAADGSYSLGDLAADAASVIMEIGPPVVLCGASIGGMTALTLLAARPELGQALVLVDITPRIEPTGAARILGFMSGAPDGFATLGEASAAISDYTGRTRGRLTSRACSA